MLSLALYLTLCMVLIFADVTMLKYMAGKAEDAIQADALERAEGHAAQALVGEAKA